MGRRQYIKRPPDKIDDKYCIWYEDTKAGKSVTCIRKDCVEVKR